MIYEKTRPQLEKRDSIFPTPHLHRLFQKSNMIPIAVFTGVRGCLKSPLVGIKSFRSPKFPDKLGDFDSGTPLFKGG